MEVEQALASRGGAARREGLRADGLTDRQLDRAVRAGAVLVLDSAVRQHQVTVERLDALARCARGPGAARLRRAVAHVDAMAGSVLESRARLLVDLLTSDVQSQVYVEGVGWVDLLLNGWLVIEPDGPRVMLAQIEAVLAQPP